MRAELDLQFNNKLLLAKGKVNRLGFHSQTITKPEVNNNIVLVQLHRRLFDKIICTFYKTIIIIINFFICHRGLQAF